MLSAAHGRGWVLERAGLGACLLATVLGVALHVAALTDGGALWRDEASCIQLAHATDLSVKWRLERDNFPLVFYTLTRVWSAVGIGANDFGWRLLGSVVGLGILGAMWVNGRLMGVRWPYMSLGLLAANLTVVYWGDSLRPYGCGALLMMLTTGLLWKLVRAPGRWSFLGAGLAAVLSVQALYQNAFLLLAACLAACAVCGRHRKWRTAAMVLGVGMLAALSLLPYVPILLGEQDYMGLFKMGFQADRAWAVLGAALGSGLDWPLLGWLVLAPFVLAAAWGTVLERASDAPIGFEDLPLFGVTALVLGAALFFVFVRLSEFAVQPWYFLPLMAFAGTALDAALANWCRQFRAGAAVFVVAMVCLPFPAVWQSVQQRRTNVDLIAAELGRRAKPGDFIVVSSCYCGITFARYFRAPVIWTTLPPFEDYRFHRPDLLQEKLCSKSLLQGVMDQAAQALSSGHTLWVVGMLASPAPGEVAPPELPASPGPGQPFGYVEACQCGSIWERQVAHLLSTRPQSVNLLRLGTPGRISAYEDLPLFMATGWRGNMPPGESGRGS